MFDQLKKLMKPGERYIIVESGKPEYVLMRFEDYVVLTTVKGLHSPERDYDGTWQTANRELEEARPIPTEVPGHVPETGVGPDDPRSIRLEDLPL